MYSSDVKITHLFHSGFIVEVNDKLLIFDYFDYTKYSDLDSSGLLHSAFFKAKKKVFVFATHSHKDHFESSIFSWQDQNSNIKYILSDDIKVDASKDNVYFMKKYEQIHIGDLKIITYGTTDLGLSFLVKVDNIGICHAGDLNWWHWKNDSPETQAKEEKDFKNEVDRMKGEKIDVAFIPVDPRLEEYYYLGGKYFAETIQPKVLVPMHFQDNYSITKAFSDKLKNLNVEVPIITKENRQFIYTV